ncbi:Enoyl-CoA hydratase domain-containing protein 2, mitochondrial [Colletotrichum higginsianum]|uniref:Enoyl-CoA hydratase domain-containing protein 2, mitochondrial n=1 Tax=Colletotrichum higginsianum TaxID=80884 RepID=A0A4T0WE76_9PEZI|nr:Enoyl-CoA hydratase domain-containing protein 2, mitochondrial [Colletotrichum higginsianum]
MPAPRLFLSALAGYLISSTLALELPKYRGLKTAQNGSVLEVTLHNPDSAINLWSQDFQEGLTDLVQKLQVDNETKVVVFKSDVSRFFCAHVDLLIPDIQTVGDRFSALMWNITNLPQVTIGAVEGRARGAGNEFLLALDMRFATKTETLLGQIEVGTGLVPGGGGGQLLSQIIGRGLAMEYILSGKDINAEDAEKIGWINKAFNNAADMYAHVNELTSRFSLFPRGALVAAKNSINLWARPPQENFLKDAAAFNARLADPVVTQLLGRALVLTNNLTLGDMELNLGSTLPLLYQ